MLWKNVFMCSLVCKGLPNGHHVGVARGTVFQEIRGRGLVSTPAILDKENLGGLLPP